jgi:hypothetical protein
MQELVIPEERDVVKLLWLPEDEWKPYLDAHMTAVRAKYFPANKAKA